MIYVLLAVAVLVALGLLAFAYGRRSDVLGDVDRFHRAREMTTSWSTDAQHRSQAGPAPHGGSPEPAQEGSGHDLPPAAAYPAPPEQTGDETPRGTHPDAHRDA